MAPTDQPLISVVIPCFNARMWIRAALASVVDQGVDCETIVVDDGSTDGTPKIVAREFPDVRLVRSEHAGPSRARNIGTALARGAFIQYLDADDVLAQCKLSRQVEALKCSGADVAYGDWCELRAAPEGTYQAGRTVARRIEGDAEIALFTDFWCPPAAYLFRREIVERVGTWNESLPVIQDARFVLDCALHGARFVYCPGPMAMYRVHASGSVSTRDPVAFTRDCLNNAFGVERWWRQHGGLTPWRTSALVRVYGQVARASYGCSPDLFESAYAALNRLQPGYVPARPRHLRLASRTIGYRRAEMLAFLYRRVKRRLQTREPRALSHGRLRGVAWAMYTLPGARAAVRASLRTVIQDTPLPRIHKQRLHNFFAVDVAPTGASKWTVRVPETRPLHLELRVDDGLTRYWYFWGYTHYEQGTARLLRTLLRSARAFVDVGANLGYYSLLAGRLLAGRGLVHAFEPWSELYEDLARNAALNKLTNLRVHRMALSDEDVPAAPLFIPRDGQRTTASLVDGFIDSDRVETVPSMRFDSYCAQHGVERVDLMKIDVEGAELRVLRGMGDLLSAWQPDIILEVLQPFETELNDFFATSGYRKFRIRDNGLEEISRLTSDPHDRNIYLTRTLQPPPPAP